MATENNDQIVQGNKWLSRKFIASMITLICLIVGNILDFDGEQMATLLIPMVYVIIEGINDAIRISKKE